MIGSVNRPAIFELKPGETVDDVLRMAGGFSAVADRSRLAIERLDDRADVRIVQIGVARRTARPTLRQRRRAARVQRRRLRRCPSSARTSACASRARCSRPGEYVLPAGSAIDDAMRAAGGLTDSAYLFGTEFNRESVRRTQQENYERALRDLETELARAVSTQRTTHGRRGCRRQRRAASHRAG